MQRTVKIINHLYEGFLGYIQGIDYKNQKYQVLIYKPLMVGTFELNNNQFKIIE